MLSTVDDEPTLTQYGAHISDDITSVLIAAGGRAGYQTGGQEAVLPEEIWEMEKPSIYLYFYPMIDTMYSIYPHH